MSTYTLLALSGIAPQVVTEVAWSLARQHVPALTPDAVEVVATGVGESYGRALLLGEQARDPVSGQTVAHAADRWGPFCADVFGHPVPIRFHVPTADGQPLADVTGVDADRQFADLCYALVARLTAPGSPPLVGSLAGGRKTMGAHLMTAFAVYARPEDRLVHVLVHPASAERDPDFFHPHPGSDARVHRVDVPFPRLRSVLTTGLVGRALAEGADLRSLLMALEPHLAAERVPDTFEITLRGGGADVVAAVDGQRVGAARLTPAEAATLLVLTGALAAGAGRCRLDALVSNGAVEDRRADVLAACGRFELLRPWTAAADVSKAVSRLNRALGAVPVVARFLAIESDVLSDATYYRWAERPPAAPTVSGSAPLPR